MLPDQWVRFINACFPDLPKIKSFEDLCDGVHLYKMLCLVSPSFDAQILVSNKKKNLENIVEHIASYYSNFLNCEITFDLNMEELFQGSSDEIKSLLKLCIGIIFSPKYPPYSREKILQNMKKLTKKDQDSMDKVIRDVIDQYDLDVKEKSFNISTTSATSSSSPFLSRKSFSNQISNFEEKNNQLINEIENLKNKLQEEIDSKKRLEEIVKSLKSSNRTYEKKNEELKKENKKMEQEKENLFEKTNQLETTVENLMKNNSTFKNKYEQYCGIKEKLEKENREYEKKFEMFTKRENELQQSTEGRLGELMKLNQSLQEIKQEDCRREWKQEIEYLKNQLYNQQEMFIKQLKEAREASILECQLVSGTFYKEGVSKFKRILKEKNSL